MTDDEYHQPSDIAVEYLKRRIKEDKSLPTEVREADLSDLASNPDVVLASLVALLEKEVDNRDTPDQA